MMDNENTQDTPKRQYSTKGVDKIKNTTPEEKKEYRRDVMEACKNMIARGLNYTEKYRQLAKRFNVSERQARNYIKKCHAEIKKKNGQALEMELDEVLIQLKHLYSENVQGGNLKDALACLNQLIKLRGYEAPKQLNINSSVSHRADLSHLSADELLLMQNLISGKRDIPQLTQGQIIDITPNQDGK